MTIRYFDPKQMTILFGVHKIVDVAETFLSVSFDEPRFRLVSGIDGDSTRIRNQNRSATIEVTLLQSSLSNDYLSGFLTVDELTGVSVLPFFAKDDNSNNTIIAPSCFIEGMPSHTYGTTGNNQVWRFRTDNLILWTGKFKASDTIYPDGSKIGGIEKTTRLPNVVNTQ